MSQQGRYPLAHTATAVAIAVTTLLGGALLAGPAHGEDACTWGEPGYRDCVDRLIAAKKEEEARGVKSVSPPAAAPANEPNIIVGNQGSKAKTAAAKRKRPGAGSLTPISPAPDDYRPPSYDPAMDAVISARRQYQFDQNMRRNANPVPSPILPPVVNPPMGRICPSWGC